MCWGRWRFSRGPPTQTHSAGEAGVIPSAAVFASAIEDAEGFPITSMPISPSELFALRLHHEQKLQEGPHA